MQHPTLKQEKLPYKTKNVGFNLCRLAQDMTVIYEKIKESTIKSTEMKIAIANNIFRRRADHDS